MINEDDYIKQLNEAFKNKQDNKFIELLENMRIIRDRIKDNINYNAYMQLEFFLQKGIEIAPKNDTIFYNIIDLYYLQKKYDGIIQLEHRILNMPQPELTVFLLVEAYWKEQKFAKIYPAVKVLANNLKEKKATKYLNTVLNPLPVDKLEITKYHSLENIVIENISTRKEIYFLGENGVGKTIMLQAIVSALKIADYSNFYMNAFLDRETKPLDFPYINTFGYGVGRLRVHNSETDETGHGTLFDQQKVNLTDPILWLKEIDRLNIRNINSLKLETVLNMVNDILSIQENNQSPDIKIIADNKTGDIIFKEQDTVVDFKNLADGYRSIFIVLIDLLKRLMEYQPDIKNVAEFKGVVLIDEVDMLLHPKWEYTIVKKLRNKFPNIQWFFTTHSPMLILGASEDAVFYRLYKEKGKTKISEMWTTHDVKYLMANGLITSPLFNMPTARMKALEKPEEMDTSENFLLGRIHHKIMQQIENEKQKGKKHFSKKDIDEFVDWAINEIKQQ